MVRVTIDGQLSFGCGSELVFHFRGLIGLGLGIRVKE
jgi:hypothetical protein